jgi:hypothetical protein
MSPRRKKVTVWVRVTRYETGELVSEREVVLPAPAGHRPDPKAFKDYDEYSRALEAYWIETLDPWWIEHEEELLAGSNHFDVFECTIIEADDPNLVEEEHSWDCW